MHKVLLVDDEIFVRKGLLNLLDWKALGYEICGEADNGELALAELDRLMPDLVIVDIRMPVMDGLAFIQAVAEKGTNVPAFIIVSGYHDFQYAKQALRYGVHDYILKPVDETELIAVLKKLSGTLGLKKLATLAGEALMTESILESLVEGNFAAEDETALRNALGLANSSSLVYVLAELHSSASPDAPAESLPAWTGKDMAAAAKEVLQLDAPPPVYEQRRDLLGILLDLARGAGGEAGLTDVCSRLQAGIERAAARPVTLYIGTAVTQLGHIKDSYKSANEACSYKFAENGAKILFADEVRGKSLYYFDIEPDQYRRLFEKLEENDLAFCYGEAEAVFRGFVEKRFAPSAVSNVMTRFVIGAINIVREMEGDEHKLTTLPAMLEWPNRQFRLAELQILFRAFLQEASAYIRELRESQSKGGIERVRKYIESHFADNISLKSIAGVFYMNPVYLGQLFRKTYGVYFNEFLLGLRIGEAKRLLRQTDLRMYEIAERVGFHNADYFVAQFEKLERQKPTDYRNGLLGRNRSGGDGA